MGTFGGDLLRILAHGGMNMGTSALGQYLGNVWGGEKELKNWLAKQLYEAAPTQPAEQQVNIQQAIEQLGGGKLPMAERIKSLSGGGLPGVTPELRGQGVSSEGGPLSFPVDKYKSLSEIPTGVTPETSKYLISPPAKLEQQVAAQVAGTPGASPLGTLGYLKRLEQPQKLNQLESAIGMFMHPDTPSDVREMLKGYIGKGDLTQYRQDMLDIRRQGLTQQLNVHNQNFQIKMQLAKSLGDFRDITGVDKAIDDLTVQRKGITEAITMGAPQKEIRGLIDQYNNTATSLIKTNPKLTSHPIAQPIEPEFADQTTWQWMKGEQPSKVVGAKPKVGTKITVPSQTPPAQMSPEEAKRRLREMGYKVD